MQGETCVCLRGELQHVGFRFVEAEGAERTFRYRQSEMMAAVPVAAQQNYFDLRLEELGPYSLSYSRNGRCALVLHSFSTSFLCVCVGTS